MLYEICFARGGLFGARSWEVVEGNNEAEARKNFLSEHPNDILIDIEIY